MSEISLNLSETSAGRPRRNRSYDAEGIRSLQPNSDQFRHEGYFGTGLMFSRDLAGCVSERLFDNFFRWATVIQVGQASSKLFYLEE